MNKSLPTKPGVINIQKQKVRSLYKWLAKVTGIHACWIEGADEDNYPVWGLIKRITGNRFLARSRRFAAASMLGASLCLLNPPVNAQSSVDASTFRGQNGFTITGGSAGDEAGESIVMGDINGDGFEDLIIGAPRTYRNGLTSATGRAFVVFGSSSGFGSSLSLSSLDGTNGFVLDGSHWAGRLGRSVASDDINGDGIDDVIISGAQGGQEFSPVYVVFGKTSPFPSQIEITSAVDGTAGFILSAGTQNIHMVTTGDINGDTFPDILVSNPQGSPNDLTGAGQIYVVFGQTSAFADTLQLSSLQANDNGFLIVGNEEQGELGADLAVGNINGDGFDDVLIGAPGTNTSPYYYGNAYAVFGQLDAFPDTLNVSNLNGSNGFRLRGNTYYNFLGASIGSGDINGDGFDEFIVRAQENGLGRSGDYTYKGEVLVIFGKSTAFPAIIDDTSFNGGTDGFFFRGINNYESVGNDLVSVDLNGDGMDELIVGGKDADNSSGKGTVYIIFGFDDTSVSEFQLSSLDGSNGFIIDGSEAIGERIATGDLDGDGHDEIVSSREIINAGRNWLITVFFNTINQTISGNEGFRLLSAPTYGPIFNELLEPFWTQGFIGADSPAGNSNVWTFDSETQAWVALTNQSTSSLSPGNGFLFYVFEDDNYDSAGNIGFPKRISVSQFTGDGTFNSGTINPVSDLTDGGFFLAGNPFGFTISWDSTAVSKTNLSETIYIYDASGAVWRTWNGTSGDANEGEIAPFQGFFVQASGGTGSLSMGKDAISDSTGVFFKQENVEPKALKIHAKADGFSSDAWLSFQEGGQLGRDAYDGLALKPLAAEYLRLATIIETLDELQINALPIDYAEELRFPLELSGVLESEIAELSFEGLEDFEEWSITIEDLQTDSVYNINPTQTLELEIRQISSKELEQPLALLPTPIAVKSKTNEHRFLLVLTPGNQVSAEPKSTLPEEPELQQNYPNPFNPTTSINFTTTTNALVRLEVFDSIGRKVAVLLNEPKTAGRYSINFNANQLASGLYIYRLQVGTKVLTKKMTLIK